jgi:hypothetical protein
MATSASSGTRPSSQRPQSSRRPSGGGAPLAAVYIVLGRCRGGMHDVVHATQRQGRASARMHCPSPACLACQWQACCRAGHFSQPLCTPAGRRWQPRGQTQPCEQQPGWGAKQLGKGGKATRTGTRSRTGSGRGPFAGEHSGAAGGTAILLHESAAPICPLWKFNKHDIQVWGDPARHSVACLGLRRSACCHLHHQPWATCSTWSWSEQAALIRALAGKRPTHLLLD